MANPEDLAPPPPTPDSEQNPGVAGEDSLASALEQDVAKEAPGGIRSDAPRFRRWLTIRDDPGGLERILLGLAFILLALLAWHVLTRGDVEHRVIGPATLPSIKETAESFPSLWYDRALMRGILASLSRVLGGFLLAASIAIPLGVIAGCYPRFHAFLRPPSIFGRNTPIATLIPLTLIWFGLGDLQKVMFIFIAAVAFIFFDTTQSVRSVPANYLDTAYTLGARTSWKQGFRKALLFGFAYALLALCGRYWIAEPPPVLAELAADTPSALARYLSAPASWVAAAVWLVAGTLLWLPVHGHQAISKVLFPLALPHIVNSLRLLFGLAFGYIVLAELIGSEYGLGKIISTSQRIGPREHIYLVLIAITILAYSIDRLIMWIQRRAFPYVTHGH